MLDEISNRRIKVPTRFPKLCSTCPEDFNQDKQVCFRRTVYFNLYFFSEFYWKNIGKLIKIFRLDCQNFIRRVRRNIFWKNIFFKPKNLKFHQCWTLKRNWFGLLSNTQQRRQNWTLRVKRTFNCKQFFSKCSFLNIVSAGDGKNFLKVWWQIFGRVAKAASFLSRWTISDKTFFFWDNSFPLWIFDFQG